MLVYCQEPRFCPDVLLNKTQDKDIESIFETITRLRELARIQIMESGAIYAKYYDRLRREYEYEPGDLVLLYRPDRVKVGTSRKLTIVWCGPYKIISKLSDLNYEIELIESEKTKNIRNKREIVHIERLRKYRENDKLTLPKHELLLEDEVQSPEVDLGD